MCYMLLYMEILYAHLRAGHNLKNMSRCNIFYSQSTDKIFVFGLFALAETDSDTDLDSKTNGYIVPCRTFHIAQTRIRIPTPYFCIGQEFESEYVPVSESGIVFKPFKNVLQS